jgi:hypothetical protein
MALCPICGCKTDELDFVNDKVAGSETRMCSFCQRQIHAFDEGKEPGDGHIRWLSSVAGKTVPDRSDEVNEYLSELRERYGAEESSESVVAPKSVSTERRVTATDSSYAELLERIEALEYEMVTYKRKARIKTIIEICVPIILGIILLLIFLSSDLFDSLSQLYNFFV